MPGDAAGDPRLKFSRDQRLKHAWEFERARREGQRLVKGCLILNWRFSDDQKISRLGVVTSKKIGNAVVRARARRLLREAFRLNQHSLKGNADLVLVARQSIVTRNAPAVARDFLSAARQAGLLLTGTA